MKSAVVCSFFNSVKEIPRLLDSLPKNIPKIMVDGRYVGFEWESDYSTDGIEDVLKNYDNIIYDRFCGEQIAKRNRCLEIAAKEGFDYVIVLDSDEYIHPKYKDWDLFNKMLDFYSTKDDVYLIGMWAWISHLWQKNWNIVDTHTWQQYVRIIKDPGLVKYHNTHYTWVHNYNKDRLLRTYGVADGVRFTFDSTLRSTEYKEEGSKWAMWNLHEENKRNNFAQIALIEKAFKVEGEKRKCPDCDFKTEPFYIKLHSCK